MSVAVGDLLAHSNHSTAWPFGSGPTRDALMLAAAAAQRLPWIIYRQCIKVKGIPAGAGMRLQLA